MGVGVAGVSVSVGATVGVSVGALTDSAVGVGWGSGVSVLAGAAIGVAVGAGVSTGAHELNNSKDTVSRYQRLIFPSLSVITYLALDR